MERSGIAVRCRRCWQDRKPYDEATYLMALKDKGSPLLQYMTE